MTHQSKNPVQRFGGADRARNLTSVAAVDPDNDKKHPESQGKTTNSSYRGTIILDVETLDGRAPRRRPILKLKYQDDGGGMVIWTGYSHADAIAARKGE